MAQTAADIRLRLAAVRTAIGVIVAGGVAEFEHEGGDKATLLDLDKLQRLEAYLVKQLASASRAGANRFRPARLID